MEASQRGGKVLLQYLGNLKGGDVRQKAPRDLVSEADKASEDVILSFLTHETPGYSILAEESGETRLKEGYCWVVDPLDGTTNFVHSLPLFAISIALLEKGNILVGVIWDPVRQELFHAQQSRGAFLNSHAISVSTVLSLRESLLVTGFPFRARQYIEPYLKVYKDFYLQAGIRRTGSAALDFAYTACGRFDGFWDLSLMPWDIAAGALLVKEAGGMLTDFLGESHFFDTGHIIASNSFIHLEMLEVVRRHFEAFLSAKTSPPQP